MDILSRVAGVFDTGSGVVRNLFIGGDLITVKQPYTHYTYELSSLAPGYYQLRFAEADNIQLFNMGVDNVSLTTVPEPQSYYLVGLRLLGFVAVRRFINSEKEGG